MDEMTFSEFEDYINKVEDEILKTIDPIISKMIIPWHIQLSSIHIDLVDQSTIGDSGRSYIIPSIPRISMSFERLLR